MDPKFPFWSNGKAIVKNSLSLLDQILRGKSGNRNPLGSPSFGQVRLEDFADERHNGKPYSAVCS